MGLAWMIIVFAVFFVSVCVYVYMCASSVILRIAFPSLGFSTGDIDRFAQAMQFEQT